MKSRKVQGWGTALLALAAAACGDAPATDTSDAPVGAVAAAQRQGTTLFSFEDGATEGWTGADVAGGPWSVTEWASAGDWSLKADVNLAYGGRHRLAVIGQRNLAGQHILTARVRRSTWGAFGLDPTAQLYVKMGPNWSVAVGEAVPLASGTPGAQLVLDLSALEGAHDVREVGVELFDGRGASGKGAIYVDNVRVVPTFDPPVLHFGAAAPSFEGPI